MAYGTDEIEKDSPNAEVEADPRLDEFIRRWKQAFEAMEPQAKREHEALKFQDPKQQWDEASKRQRQGDTNASVPVPARPILSISRIAQPIRLILNQQRSARLGVNIHPLSSDSNEEIAEIKQGLYRQIERESSADQARAWAFDRAVKAGRGFYRIGTKYDEGSDSPFDQVITIDRILNQEGVYFDPSAQKMDFSDAEYVFVSNWVPIETFKRLYPDAVTPDDDEFADAYANEPDWVKDDGGQKAIRVCEHWYKEHKTRKVYLLADGTQGEGEPPKKGKVLATREIDEVSVTWCTMTAAQIVSEQPWNGRYLPIVCIIGEELQPFDGQRRFMGIIEPNMDGQRMYNFAASAAVEKAALEPKAPWLVTKEQIKGYESWWQQANNRTWPYLPYNSVSGPTGQPVPPPTRVQVDASGTSLAMMLIQQADQFLQGGTFTYDPSLGRPSRGKSGIAIAREQEQADSANSNYMQNLADVSMVYEAKVVLDLMPSVYDREGRAVRVLGTEDDSKAIIVNEPFISDPDSGEPFPVQVQRDPEGKIVMPLTPIEPVPQGAEIKYYDLSKGIYDVSVSIGRSAQTQRQEAAQEIGDILQADPSLMPLIGPIYFSKARDFPGHEEIADILKKVRNQNMPFLDESEDGAKPSADQLQAENQQLKMQIEQMGAQLQEAGQVINTEQVKQSAQLKKAEMDNATKLQIAGQDNQTKILLASLSGQLEKLTSMMQQQHEAEKAKFQAAHETGLEAQKAAQAVEMAKFTRANELSLGKDD